MGGEASKEVRLTVAPDISAEAAHEASKEEKEFERHRTRLHHIEESIFKEGYNLGRNDAMGSLEEEIKRQAKAAYAQIVIDEEKERSKHVAAEVASLERKYQRPPARKPECQAQEAALLACTPGAENNFCVESTRAYVQCADSVLLRLMNPGAAALR